MSETPHRLDGSDEAMELAFLGSVDEPDEIVRIDLQPVQDRREAIRNAAALAFDDGAAGPVDELEIVLDFVSDRALGIMRWLVGRCLVRERHQAAYCRCEVLGQRLDRRFVPGRNSGVLFEHALLD